MPAYLLTLILFDHFAMADDKAKAVKLKDEGNALFLNKEFRKAHEKYTQAIKLDDTSAIFYANRSACSLSLKKFVCGYRQPLFVVPFSDQLLGIWMLLRMRRR